MPTAEPRVTRGQAVAVATALILIAGAIGLILAPDRSGGQRSGESVISAEAAAEARSDTLREVTAASARKGFRDGRVDGLRHGRMTGRQVGRTDAEIAIGEQAAASAQAEAASARAELSAMSAAPPAP